jgi:soluble lytic murein transglycosylase
MASADDSRYPPGMLLSRTTKALLLAGTLVPFTIPVAAAAADPFKDERSAFQRAYAQVDAAEPQRPDSEALRTYPLYPYLQAARIRRALANANGKLTAVDQRAATFTTYYEREPVGRELRRVWLASLAEREHWQMFAEQYRDAVADDSLRCQSLTARVELERTTDLAADIAKQWLTPRSLPDCERPFEWLRSQNALTPTLIEQRVRLALGENNTGLARQLIAALPETSAAPLLQWADLIDAPQRQIDALIATPVKAVEETALLAGWTRLTRANRDAAIERFDALVSARNLQPSRYALALAQALAWNRHPEALGYFRRVAPADLDDYALEWQTRASLWADDWQLVSTSIAAMSDEQRAQARWRYWAARAAERNDDFALARQLYESVLVDDNFYSMLAATRLDQPLAPHAEKLVLDEVQLKQISQLPAMVRARELMLCDMRNLANSEWAYGYSLLAEPARTQAVHLAARWGWYEQAIASAAQQRLFNDYALLYPRPFDKQVTAAARLTGLPAELIYSVMRQESLYRPDAISSAGARGLLQLMPDTARRAARTWKRPRPSGDDLFEPSINIPLGAAQLRTLVDRFGGQVIVALAGYNAGQNAAARWLPQQSVEPDVWIENIPYNETRGYVQRILWHNLVFGWLKNGEPQKPDAWLARVVPASESAVLGQR